MRLELEHKCLEIYKEETEKIRKRIAELQLVLDKCEVEIDCHIFSLGGEESEFPKKKEEGSLSEQISTRMQVLKDLRIKTDLRRKELSETLFQIADITSNIPTIDESDLTVKKLDELKSHLHELRSQKVFLSIYIHVISICYKVFVVMCLS